MLPTVGIESAADCSNRRKTMIYKVPSNQPGCIRVVFELPSCVWADRIFVSGSFNGWNEGETPMRQDRDGVWRASIDMPMGKQYEFRYIVDGRWQTDFHADGSATNSFGSQNSVIDLSLVVALPVNMRHSSQVSDGHVSVAPHLPAPSDMSSSPVRARAHVGPDIPRLRPRIAAA
jgi:hypothetical protein